MAITLREAGKLVTADTTIHTGRGRIMGYLISHAESTVQTVTFYDNTAASGTVAHLVHVAPEQSPVFIQFARRVDESKLFGIDFDTGLTVVPGNCAVAVWCIGY